MGKAWDEYAGHSAMPDEPAPPEPKPGERSLADRLDTAISALPLTAVNSRKAIYDACQELTRLQARVAELGRALRKVQSVFDSDTSIKLTYERAYPVIKAALKKAEP